MLSVQHERLSISFRLRKQIPPKGILAIYQTKLQGI